MHQRGSLFLSLLRAICDTDTETRGRCVSLTVVQMLIDDLDELHEVRSVEDSVLAVRQALDEELIRVAAGTLLVRVFVSSAFDLEPIEAQDLLVKINCKGICHAQLDSNRIDQVLTVKHSVARDCLEVELLITCVLVQDEQVLV